MVSLFYDHHIAQISIYPTVLYTDTLQQVYLMPVLALSSFKICLKTATGIFDCSRWPALA